MLVYSFHILQLFDVKCLDLGRLRTAKKSKYNVYTNHVYH